MMEMVLFENVAPYYAEGIKNESKLVDIDKIAFVRESGTPEFPTLTLELQSGVMFEFNKVNYRTRVFECSDLSSMLTVFNFIKERRAR